MTAPIEDVTALRAERARFRERLLRTRRAAFNGGSAVEHAASVLVAAYRAHTAETEPTALERHAAQIATSVLLAFLSEVDAEPAKPERPETDATLRTPTYLFRRTRTIWISRLRNPSASWELVDDDAMIEVLDRAALEKEACAAYRACCDLGNGEGVVCGSTPHGEAHRRATCADCVETDARHASDESVT